MSMFDITNFQAKLNQYQGLAKTSLFVVDIDRIGQETFRSGDIRFFCQSAAIPGITLNTSEHKANTFGHGEQLPVGIGIEPVACLFMLDSKHEIMTFFHQWLQAIVNFNGINMNAEVDGKLPYEIGYRDEYCANMTITFYSAEDGANSYSVTLHDAFPINVGTLTLSYADNNQYAMLPVSFGHSGITMSSLIEGTATNRMNRANGMLGLITTYGGGGGLIGQLIRQTGAYTNLQSAIDKFSKVKNALNAIKSIF